jgi:hypothetical protein
MIGNESLGYLVYDKANDKFLVYVIETSTAIEGYDDKVEQLLKNVIKTNIVVSQTNSQVSLVLHKSKEVNAEITNMQAVIEMDILEYDEHYNITTTTKYSGTSTLTYQIGFSIVRLVPVQNIYTGTNKNYTGLSSSSEIMITLGSSFTLEYQTRYIPSAFPDIEMATMSWGISLKGYSYYMDSVLGNYLTLDDEGNCISISPTLTLDPNDKTKILVTKNASGDYQYVHDGRTLTLELHNKTNTT